MLITVQSARADIPVYKDDYNVSQPHAYSAVTIQVVDDRGKVFRTFDANSNNYKHIRHYLQARKGKKYQLRIKNNLNKSLNINNINVGDNVVYTKGSLSNIVGTVIELSGKSRIRLLIDLINTKREVFVDLLDIQRVYG